MNLKDLITADRSIVLKSRTKTEALYEMIEILETENVIKDSESLKKEIFYREQIMSTGIGQGIGIPHVRYEGVSEPVIVVGIAPEGLDKYTSMDDHDVKIVIMIIVGKEQHKEYLRILSLISRRLKDAKMRDQVVRAETGLDIARIMLGEIDE